MKWLKHIWQQWFPPKLCPMPKVNVGAIVPGAIGKAASEFPAKPRPEPEDLPVPEVPKQVDTIPPWFRIAEKEIGVSEINGKTHNQKIVLYHDATTLSANDDETAWCSSFVSWCLEESGYASTKNAWARSYLTWGEKVEKPFPGCVAVFSRGSSSGHVGFYVSESLGLIQVLGGNQSNKVCIQDYAKLRLLGYRKPKGYVNQVKAPEVMA